VMGYRKESRFAPLLPGTKVESRPSFYSTIQV
jgi:hypothetical protein